MWQTNCWLIYFTVLCMDKNRVTWNVSFWYFYYFSNLCQKLKSCKSERTEIGCGNTHITGFHLPSKIGGWNWWWQLVEVLFSIMWSLNNERGLVTRQGGVQSHKKKYKSALDLMKQKSETLVLYCQYLISLAWESHTSPDNHSSLINKRNIQTWLCIYLFIQPFLQPVTHSWHP